MSEYNQPLHTTLVDYEKAFDSVEILAAMQASQNRGVDELYVKFQGGGAATIALHKQINKRTIKKEVRQRDTISPKIFTACLNEVFRRLDGKQLGIRFKGEYVINLRIGDGIALLNNSGDELHSIIADLNRQSRMVVPKTIKDNRVDSKRQAQQGVVGSSVGGGNEEVRRYNVDATSTSTGLYRDQSERRLPSSGRSQASATDDDYDNAQRNTLEGIASVNRLSDQIGTTLIRKWAPVT